MLGRFYENSSEKCGWLLAWSKSRFLVPSNSQLVLSRLVLHPCLHTHNYKWCWTGGTLPGQRQEESRGKSTEGEEECLNEREERTTPGRQINLRDTETQKRHIKGLSGEEVMGRENSKPLNKND